MDHGMSFGCHGVRCIPIISHIYHIFTNERLKNMKVRCGDANHILERPHELDSGELISGKVEGRNS